MAAASTDTTTDTGESSGVQGAWMAMVRRARIGRERKLAMLTIGSYADADGTNIYPGVARLAADCEVSCRTAGRYLSWGRTVGLIEVVARGNRRRGLSDAYRLAFGAEILQYIDLPDPEQYRKLIAELAAANRADTRRRQRARDQAADPSFTDTTSDRRSDADLRTQGGRKNDDSGEGSTDTQVSVEPRFYGHGEPVFTDTYGVRPPPMDHLTSKNNLPWERADRRNARLLSARAGEDDEKSSSTRAVVDGPTCDDCGTILDPDGSCFVCRVPRARVRRAAAPAP